MTTPMADEMLGATVREKLQYHRMRPATYRDQHGRMWSCQVSTETLHPTTPLTPVGWRAPFPMLVPDAKYLTIGEAFGELVIDYDRWLKDVADARKEYDLWVLECARRLYGGAALQAIKNAEPELRRMAGPGPISPEFIRAMKSGASRWALGLPHSSGRPFPVPAWAEAELWTLQVHETWDGTDVDTAVDAARYADEEPVGEDEQARLERLEAQARYGDVEELADPEAAPSFAPIRAPLPPNEKRGRGRPRKT